MPAVGSSDRTEAFVLSQSSSKNNPTISSHVLPVVSNFAMFSCFDSGCFSVSLFLCSSGPPDIDMFASPTEYIPPRLETLAQQRDNNRYMQFMSDTLRNYANVVIAGSSYESLDSKDKDSLLIPVEADSPWTRTQSFVGRVKSLGFGALLSAVKPRR